MPEPSDFFSRPKVALTLGLTGAALGWSLAPYLVEVLSSALGVGATFIRSRADGVVLRAKLSALLAFPPFVTWAALSLRRRRTKRHLRDRISWACLVLPWLSGLAAAGARLGWLRWTLRTAELYGVEPLLASQEIVPGAWGIPATGASGLLLIIVCAFGPTGRDDTVPRREGEGPETARE